jgi:hypothetical protein
MPDIEGRGAPLAGEITARIRTRFWLSISTVKMTSRTASLHIHCPNQPARANSINSSRKRTQFRHRAARGA